MYAEAKANEALAAGDMAQFQYWMQVKKNVDCMPPLTPRQKDALRELLRTT